MAKLQDLDLLDPEVVQCPFDFYAAAREDAPVYKLPNSPIPGKDVYFVSSYELVVQALRDWETYSNQFGHLLGRVVPADEEIQAIEAQGYQLAPTMLTQDPPLQRQYRNLVNKAFNARRVASLEPYIRDLCHQLIDDTLLDTPQLLVWVSLHWYSYD